MTPHTATDLLPPSTQATWHWLRHALLVLACAVLAGCATGPTPTRSENTVGTDNGTWVEPNASLTRRSPPMVPGGLLQPIQTGQTMAFQVISLNAPSDLWERIRRGFAMPGLEGDLVSQH
ncbi:MAG: hypothetical protein U1D28_03830, partial [Burkholderiales bacterium]|nr:hypothetical protein [Burkholderiales bacterium]